MPGIFGDHMVLQSDTKLPVWGWADPSEKVSVTLGKDTLTAETAADGSWRVDFPAVTRSDKNGPVTLTVAGHNTITYQEVLLGDVWVASGAVEHGFRHYAR